LATKQGDEQTTFFVRHGDGSGKEVVGVELKGWWFIHLFPFLPLQIPHKG
jgi:hypothetical protein